MHPYRGLGIYMLGDYVLVGSALRFVHVGEVFVLAPYFLGQSKIALFGHMFLLETHNAAA